MEQIEAAFLVARMNFLEDEIVVINFPSYPRTQNRRIHDLVRIVSATSY